MPALALLLVFLLRVFLLPTPVSAAEPLRVAVASNFRVAAEELAERFSGQTDIEVLLSAASTGVLVSQIRGGAPFDLLLAADRRRPQILTEQGLSLEQSRCYAQGSLVLLGADLLVDNPLEHALKGGQSIAIANPRSAPYGEAAQVVLKRFEPEGGGQRRVVMGGNVQQAYQFFHSGAAELALIARSLSPTAGLAIPVSWHAPIDQYLLILATTTQPDTARRFADFLTSPPNADLLAAMGYSACS